jgi:hypothetical protein
LKTQIITLESHDDLISVRDKLTWAKTPRVLLVWPKYEKVALRLLDLKVLQRHADSLGAQVGLVTRRANVRRDAESLGIPVFDSTTSAQRESWPAPVSRVRRVPKTPRRDLRNIRDEIYKPESHWLEFLPVRILIFAVGVMAVLAIACLFIPRATLTLYPESQTQQVTIPISASEANKVTSITGSVPARTLSLVLDSKQSLDVTGQIPVPESKSKGVARFTNLSQGEVNIPANTTIATKSAIRFVTLNDTRLPAGIDQFVDVPIEALEAGEKGNVDADAITIVEGALGLSISVKNLAPIKGGTSSQLVGPADDDRAKLSGVVMDGLNRDAESKFRAKIGPSDVLLPDTIEIVKINKEDFEPPVGKPGKTLALTMQVEFSARYVSGDDLKEIALSALNTLASPGFETTTLPTYKVVAAPSTDSSGSSHFELEATRTLLHQVDQMQVFSIVRAQNRSWQKKFWFRVCHCVSCLKSVFPLRGGRGFLLSRSTFQRR